MVSMRKTNVNLVPVTAEVNGERVVVGEATLIATKSEIITEVRLDLDTPEGLNMESMLSRGITNAISVSTSDASLINQVVETNKQYKKDNPDDGTVGTE